MADAEETRAAIAAVGRGERVTGPHSIHASAGTPCPGGNCRWRTLFCDNDTDVVECRICGAQGLARCTFDEEYA